MSGVSKLQVLLIEDERSTSLINQLKMQSSSCDIKVVKNEQEATKELNEKKYDLVIWDWGVMKGNCLT